MKKEQILKLPATAINKSKYLRIFNTETGRFLMGLEKDHTNQPEWELKDYIKAMNRAKPFLIISIGEPHDN